MNFSTDHTQADLRFMAHAAMLARRAKGRTAPNPCVGAVLVRGGEIVAEGWHQVYGGPHAEVNCLADARRNGIDPAACTLYVTLEPCNHHGKTPPCSQAVLAARIPEVVVGCLDPNPGVTGGGADFLRQCGVNVRVGVMEAQCKDLIADFYVWRFTPRTFNTLKMATTLDGRIAARNGHSAWVSSPESRAAVHELRSRVDAVVVGGSTLRTDNPRLTARPIGAAPGRQPLAVVVTSILPDPKAPLALLTERPGQTIFWTNGPSAASARACALREHGADVWELPANGEGLSLGEGFIRLRAEKGCHATLCEGGGRLAMSLMEQDLMDEFVCFLAPKVLGDEAGIPLFSGRNVDSMERALALRLADAAPSGADLRLTYMPVRQVR